MRTKENDHSNRLKNCQMVGPLKLVGHIYHWVSAKIILLTDNILLIWSIRSRWSKAEVFLWKITIFNIFFMYLEPKHQRKW